MAYDNEDNYHGMRFLLDAQNSRQFGVRYDHGKVSKPIHVFAEDDREAGFKPNETVFAFDDEAKITTDNGKARLSTVAYQIITNESAEPKKLKELSVDYDVTFRGDGAGNFKVVYKLSPTSRDALAERGFDASFPQEFSEAIDPRGLSRNGVTNQVVVDRSTLSNLSFPPQHTTNKAHLARYALEGNDLDSAVMPRPEDIVSQRPQAQDNAPQKPVQQPTTAPANQNPSEPAPQKPAPQFNRQTTFRPPVVDKPKISDSAIEAVIKMFCEDLSEKAARGQLDPVVGRNNETQAAIKVMSQRKQSSLCFTGEAGVGKTAMFSAVAQYIHDGDQVPDSMRGARVLQLDLQAMNAGAKYRGEFEAKLKPLIEGLKERQGYLNGRKVILAIDEIHSQLTSGKAEGGTDAGNMMKPFLTSKGISVMGATTDDEYKKHIEKDPALARRFEAMRLEEPKKDDTLHIVQKLWPLIRDHHGIAKDPSAEEFQYLVNMTNRYAPNESQPSKAEKALDMAAASAKFRGSDTIEREDFLSAISKMSKLSADFLGQNDRDRFLKLEASLNEQVLGQPGIGKVASGLIGSRVGLNDPNKPMGCFVLQGPSGTGKTELCKALARTLFGDEKALIKLDMSEYMEKHSVARLIGAPPGYVGFDSAQPALTEEIRQRPYSILLLDEIEKAHPDVFNVLLPVLNDGEMKDNQGKTVKFNNVIVVMTTNLGAKEAMAALQGGGSSNGLALGGGALEKTPQEQQEILAKIYERERKSFFRPEMVNRIEMLGGFITFIPLAQEVITKLVNRELKNVNSRLSDPTGANFGGVTLEVSADVKLQLAQEGYKPDMGARPLEKVVREKLGNPLAFWLLENEDKLKTFAAANGGAKLYVEKIGADFNPVIKAPKEELVALPAAKADKKTAADFNASADAAAPAKKARKPRNPANDTAGKTPAPRKRKSGGNDFNA